jgi:hypothetical protein
MDVHLIAVTRWSQERDRERARQAGCDESFGSLADSG